MPDDPYRAGCSSCDGMRAAVEKAEAKAEGLRDTAFAITLLLGLFAVLTAMFWEGHRSGFRDAVQTYEERGCR